MGRNTYSAFMEWSRSVVRIILYRHELCSGKGFIGGGSDVGLTDEGKDRAVNKAEILKILPVSRVYASPLKRCVETLNPYLNLSSVPVVYDNRLKEINFGDWEGRSYRELERHFPVRLKDWYKSLDTGPPGGESLEDLENRVMEFWEERLLSGFAEEEASSDERLILIVTHGGPIRTILSRIAGGGIENHWSFTVDRGNFCLIEIYNDGITSILGTNIDSFQLDSKYNY